MTPKLSEAYILKIYFSLILSVYQGSAEVLLHIILILGPKMTEQPMPGTLAVIPKGEKDTTNYTSFLFTPLWAK